MKTTLSEKVRHLVLRGTRGEPLPEALLTACREHGVARAWLRGGGAISDVVLRTRGDAADSPDVLRRIAGPVQLLLLEGSLGIQGDAALSLRAVLARETDRGLDTLAGEIVAARIVTFEAIATALDDVVLAQGDSPEPPRADAPHGAFGASGSSLTERAPPPPPSWSDAIAASSVGVREVLVTPGSNPGSPSNHPVPPRPVRHDAEDVDSIFPEAGDLVDHFAFGRCEVLKSDGDRLHLRVGKDGRVREIALEMLRVLPVTSPLPNPPPQGEGAERRHFRLERKL